eukprot:2341431-Rhodomonas_salina.1
MEAESEKKETGEGDLDVASVHGHAEGVEGQATHVLVGVAGKGAVEEDEVGVACADADRERAHR